MSQVNTLIVIGSVNVNEDHVCVLDLNNMQLYQFTSENIGYCLSASYILFFSFVQAPEVKDLHRTFISRTLTVWISRCSYPKVATHGIPGFEGSCQSRESTVSHILTSHKYTYKGVPNTHVLYNILFSK